MRTVNSSCVKLYSIIEKKVTLYQEKINEIGYNSAIKKHYRIYSGG